MEVTDALIEKWEPKIHKMGKSIGNLEDEDVQQELRIVLCKCAKGFDESRGVSFHTYLHKAMVTTLMKLQVKWRQEHYPIDLFIHYLSYDHDESSVYLSGLTSDEKEYLEMRLKGYNNTEITKVLKSVSRIRKSLQDKIRREML